MLIWAFVDEWKFSCCLVEFLSTDEKVCSIYSLFYFMQHPLCIVEIYTIHG